MTDRGRQMRMNIVQIIFTLLGWALFILRWAYHKYDKLFLGFQYMKFYLLNLTTIWNVSFEFKLREENSKAEAKILIEKAKNTLLSGKDAKIFHDYEFDKTIMINGVCYQLNYSDFGVHFQINDQRLPFREAKKLLLQELLPLIEKLERNLSIMSEQYALTVKFGDRPNPYYGLFLQRLRGVDIKTFNCVFNIEQGNQENVVSVGKETLCIISGSREAFKSASLKYLSLSGT